MSKVAIGPGPYLYPMPVLLVGDDWDGGPRSLGPRVVILRADATPEAVLDALRDLNRQQAGELGHPETLTRIAQYEMAFRMQTSVPELTDLASSPLLFGFRFTKPPQITLAVARHQEVELTSTEFSILLELLQHRGDVVSKRDLYLPALGREPAPHDRSVDMHVSNLRRKLGPDPRGDNRIETIRGIGYQYRVA